MLSAALAGSRTISFCLAASHALPRARHPVFSRLTPGYLGGKTEVCLRPLICYGQTRASRPPPLQHRVPTRAARKFDLSNRSGGVSLIRIAPGPFQWQVDPPLGTGTRPGLTTGPFQPHGILDIRMSLSTFSFLCRRRATAILRYGRNPCVIQADAEPPGRHPPAPGSHVRRSTPSPGDLSLAQVWWGFPRLSSIPAPIAFVLTESPAMIWALLHCFE